MCFYTTIFPYPSTNDLAGTVLMGLGEMDKNLTIFMRFEQNELKLFFKNLFKITYTYFD